jgi:hypothetical protein
MNPLLKFAGLGVNYTRPEDFSKLKIKKCKDAKPMFCKAKAHKPFLSYVAKNTLVYKLVVLRKRKALVVVKWDDWPNAQQSHRRRLRPS